MKKRAITFITLMMFVITNVIGVMPTVYADEIKSVFYKYNGYTVGYSVLESWDDTQKVSVSIQNTGEETIENWMIYFKPNGEIYDIWDAEKAITSQPLAYIRNSRYNADIKAGETTNFTYLIKNNDVAPESFSLCQSRMNVEDGYLVDFNEINSWEDTNFQGEIILTNNTSESLEAWELTVDTNFTINQITNSWSADVENLDEGKYLLKGTYNSIIQPYSSIILGFLGTKNSNPEISDYSLSVVAVDEAILSSINSNEDEEIVLTDLSMYATGKVSDNVLYVSWIPDKEVSGVEYKVIACDDEKIASCITETNDLGYEYVLEDNFVNKRVYVEAYYKDEFVGKSNEFIVNNTDGVFVSELVDTDKDGISDYIEELIGTDINMSDTDEDGLNDYLEFFVLETDPLLKDSDNNGVWDGDEDCDSDGLTNLEEISNLTSPVKSDSDNDKLSDYDELFTYNTNPLLEDTDMDGMNDYDEVMLGINPNDSTDSCKVVEQKIDTYDECLNGVNVGGLPYDVSMKIKASGYVAGSLKAENSLSYSSTYSFDTIGEIPEFNYDGGNVEEVSLNFEFDDEYIAENEIDFDALNIFKYYDEVNMFIPLKTDRNEDKKILSCESDSLGTFCIKDVNEWLLNFSDPVSGSEDNINFFDSDVNIMAKAVGNNTTLLSSSETEIGPVNVVFAVDRMQFIGMMSFNRPTQIKENIINVSEELFKRYSNVNVYIVVYGDGDASYTEECKNIDAVKNVVDNISFMTTRSMGQYIEKPIKDVSVFLPYVYPNYYFIYDGSYYYTEPPYKEQIETNLKQSKACHVCFVPAGISLNSEYIEYYANNYSGKIFKLFSETIDDDVLNFIAKEPKLKKKTSHITPGADDEPSDNEPENTKPSNKYIISSNLTTVTLDAPLTKNSKVDSDNDGLTDVEELIQSDKLIKWDTDGNIILPTLNEVIRYCGLYAGMEYLPDDILGYRAYEEYLKKPVLPVRSNPKDGDTDRDTYSDYEEVMVYNSDPITFNSLVSVADIDFLADNMSYGASLCRDDYDESLFVEGCVWIANNCFGSAHDYKLIYKEALLNYFKDVAEEEDGEFNTEEFLYNVNIGTQIEALASKSVKLYGDQIKPMFEYIVEDYRNTLLLYRNSAISSKTFLEKEQELVEEFLNNKYINSFVRNRKIGAVFDDLDSINTHITIASIAVTGLVSMNKSFVNYDDIINYRETILREKYILDYIISDSKNETLVNTAKDIKKELESSIGEFLVESTMMLEDFSYAVGDATYRWALSLIDGGAVIVASIAIYDLIFGVSDIGIKRIQCNAYATISDSVSNKMISDFVRLERNSRYALNGEYIIYDDFSLYSSDVRCIYKSRKLGEDTINEMDKGYSGLFIPEDYSKYIDLTRSKLKEVYLRSMGKYER